MLFMVRDFSTHRQNVDVEHGQSRRQFALIATEDICPDMEPLEQKLLRLSPQGMRISQSGS